MPRAIGSVATSASSEAPINDQTYNEQTSGAQRSIKSASANDAAAGTGVRKVRVVYFTLSSAGVVAGPFAEILTLNGTTAVPFVATDAALIESIEAVECGSGGVAAGAITLYAAADGTGTAIAVLASGATRTSLGHHYVASGKRCHVTDIEGIGGDAAIALLNIRRRGFPAATSPEVAVVPAVGVTSALPRSIAFASAPHSPIVGPCRVRLTVTPGNTNAQTTRASFGFYDR